MATFQYKARTKEGEIRSGAIETSSREAALDTLQQSGLVVTALQEQKKKFDIQGFFPFLGGVSQKDLVVFSRQISTLFEAQIPVVDALKTLVGQTSRPALREIIARVLDDVAGGLSISQAMAKHPRVFSAFYTNLIRSGEESGKLQEIFSYLAEYLERSYYLTTKARNSMIYPAFVLVAFIGVLIVMLVVVVPRLITIFEETGQRVPFYTQIVIYASLALRKWGVLLAILLVAFLLGIWRWAATAGGKRFFNRLQLNIPIVGELYRKLYIARITDNLRTLIMGGIPIMRALAITGDVVGNIVYEQAVKNAIESVKGGGMISAAFERTPEIPIFVTNMIKIGETSGRLDFILGSISKYYQREVESVLDNLVALIEPALIIFLGVGIGVLVASIMIPLYNLVGSM